ncbi:MAG: AAA family ATPase [Eubacteriales bacterium]
MTLPARGGRQVKIKIWNVEQPAGSGLKVSNRPGAPPAKPAGKSKAAGEDKNQVTCAREIMQELDALVGLSSVKKLIGEIYAFVEIQKRRQKEKLVTQPLVLHMIFKGNPGTGKTTVARILGKLFKDVGVLAKGHLVEVERADMVGEFIGHTAQKTREQIKKALGGILFIDEAYSLARGGEKDFGKEAIDALVKGMEDHRDNLILILAGYQDEMDWFTEANPGLRSRFPIHISFPDYDHRELLAIADLMMKKREYFLTSGAREELRFLVEKERRRHEHSGNARLVRNLLERAIRRQAVRLLNQQANISRDDLMTITREDIEDNGGKSVNPIT